MPEVAGSSPIAPVSRKCDWIAELLELIDTRFVDLPTSHWSMWSVPERLAEIIATEARS